MTLLVSLDTAPSFAPREAVAAPDRLIEGAPAFKTWDLDTARSGQVRTGIWEGTPGTTRSIKGETFEYCHLLEGVIEITEDGGPTQRFQAGDDFVLKPGFVGTWKTIETVKKIFVIVT
ncbi:cupin domain-containing protein [Lichenihabitans sp. Uapishka_5]|uniref:cupin domain-containing protein n=1 Tax=Lichenihabitans sp. Uapishka_5 TaxID=3037302 RepID=UPI0029E7E903|nr:cupin domain-containing protein [Lichenihabitans sp. Uapishka_5]MDX7950542.1 cupin domain-containing protein [Lichenihabitans sp. Uapishka_5]